LSTAAQEYDVKEVLLHRGAMLLLDEIDSCSNSKLQARVCITGDSTFFEPHAGVPAWVAMEYMAQAVGALGGIKALQRGEAVPLGLLIGCQKFSANQSYFTAGQTLTVTATEIVADDYGLGAFDCSIKSDEELASGRLTVFVQADQSLT